MFIFTPVNFGFSVKFVTKLFSSNSTKPNLEIGFVTVIVAVFLFTL